MPPKKSPEKCRQRKLIGLTPENVEYIESKADRFQRGNKGGFTEAVNRCIEFCRNYEERMGK